MPSARTVAEVLTLPRKRMFYGWWVVAASSLGLCFSTGTIVVLSFGVFLKPLSLYFHAGRAAISLAFTLHNLLGALCVPLTGSLIDRFGARRIILTGTPIFASFLLSSLLITPRIEILYCLFAALGLISGGTSPVPYGAVVARWFDRRRGLALGTMMLGLGVGAMTIPLIAHQLIIRFGWRIAYATLGCAVLLALPVLAAVLHDDPRKRGLLPDGAALKTRSELREQNLRGLSWHDIWHEPSFWLLVSTFFLVGASVHGCVLHMPALLSDRGVSAHGAAVGSSLVGLALVMGRVSTGYLLDHFFAPRLAMLLLGGAALGMALLWAGGTGKLALLAAFLIGFGMGAEVDIIAFCMSRYFGLKTFGTAFAYAFGAYVLGGALGTLIMGTGFDWMHSYTAALGVLLCFILLGVGLLTRLGPYRYPVLHSLDSQAVEAELLGLV